MEWNRSSVRWWAIGALLLGGVLAARADIPSVSELGRDERLVFVRVSTSPGHRDVRIYEFAGNGQDVYCAVTERASKMGAFPSGPHPDFTLGTIKLTEDEVLGLDIYLLFLRGRFKGDCSLSEDISIGYYRGEEKVAEEHYHDATCALADIRYVDGEIYRPERADLPAGFPPGLYQRVVPPWVIEQRLRETKPAAMPPQ